MPSSGRFFPASAVRFTEARNRKGDLETRGFIEIGSEHVISLPKAVFAKSEGGYTVRCRKALAKLRKAEVPVHRHNGSKSSGKPVKRPTRR